MHMKIIFFTVCSPSSESSISLTVQIFTTAHLKGQILSTALFLLSSPGLDGIPGVVSYRPQKMFRSECEIWSILAHFGDKPVALSFQIH